MMAGHHAATFLQLEETNNTSLSKQFLEANLTTLQIGFGNILSSKLVGYRIQNLERNLAEYSRNLLQSPIRHSQLPLFHNESTKHETNINLLEMSDAEITRRLFARAVHWHLRNLEDSSSAPSTEMMHDLGLMAQYQNTSIAQLIRNAGIEAFIYLPASPHLTEIRRNPIQDLENRNIVKPPMQTQAQRRESMRVFLDAAFHSRSSVASYLMMANLLAAMEGMGWREMIEYYLEHPSSYERSAKQFVASRGGEVPFEDYFDFVMFESEHGVYTSAEANHLIGVTSGLFQTPSENPALGKFVLRKIRREWRAAASPDIFEVVEMGCGNGTLAKNIFDELEALSAGNESEWGRLKSALRYHMVDRSQTLQEVQRNNLQPYLGKIIFHHASVIDGDLPIIKRGVFISVELVDMFAATPIICHHGELYEIYIRLEGGLLQEVRRPLRNSTKAFLDRHPLQAGEGKIFYIQRPLEDWMQNIRNHLEAGSILTIDYGAERNTIQNRGPEHPTFRRYGGYRSEYQEALIPYYLLANQLGFSFDSSLKTYIAGSTGLGIRLDMTVDVDFTALRETALRTRGFNPRTQTSLYDFAIDIAQDHPNEKLWDNWEFTQNQFRNFILSIIEVQG